MPASLCQYVGMRWKYVSCMWQGMSLVKMRMHKSCLILRCKQLLTKTPVRFNTFRILPACRSRCECPVFYPHSCPPKLSEHGLCMVFNARKIAVSAFSALPERLFGDVIIPLPPYGRARPVLQNGLFRETVSAPVWRVFVLSADCQCVARQVGKMLFSRRNAPVRKLQGVSDALAGLFFNIWRCPVCPLSVCTVIVRRSLRSAREPWLCRRCRCGR